MSVSSLNNDFLNQVAKNNNSKSTNVNKINNNNNSNKTNIIVVSEEERKQFHEYYALDSNKIKCLAATNYWRVMSGQTLIEVPPSDTEYYKYFDDRCLILAKSYILRRKEIEDFSKNMTKF